MSGGIEAGVEPEASADDPFVADRLGVEHFVQKLRFAVPDDQGKFLCRETRQNPPTDRWNRRRRRATVSLGVWWDLFSSARPEDRLKAAGPRIRKEQMTARRWNK